MHTLAEVPHVESLHKAKVMSVPQLWLFLLSANLAPPTEEIPTPPHQQLLWMYVALPDCWAHIIKAGLYTSYYSKDRENLLAAKHL